MKIWRFSINVRREPKPLSQESVTLLSQLVDERLSAMEANVKETRQRLETIYRKVYRDAVKEGEMDGPVPESKPSHKMINFPRPGDPIPEQWR